MEPVIIPEVELPDEKGGLHEIFLTLMADALHMDKESTQKLFNI